MEIDQDERYRRKLIRRLEFDLVIILILFITREINETERQKYSHSSEAIRIIFQFGFVLHLEFWKYQGLVLSCMFLFAAYWSSLNWIVSLCGLRFPCSIGNNN